MDQLNADNNNILCEVYDTTTFGWGDVQVYEYKITELQVKCYNVL